MSGLCLLAATLLAHGPVTDSTSPPTSLPASTPLCDTDPAAIALQTPTDSPQIAVAEPQPQFSDREHSEIAGSAMLDDQTELVSPKSQDNFQVSRKRDPLLEQLFPNTPPSLSGESVVAFPKTIVSLPPDTVPPVSAPTREFPGFAKGPASGSQLYWQRLAALQAGRLFTRIAPDSFRHFWQQARQQPTYEQWKRLLSLEARAAARGKGGNRLALLVGDSLSLWFPSGRLPGGQFWLNQGISGETTSGILRRLATISQAKPDTIYLMAGINDLRRGQPETEVVRNLHQIIRSLRQAHPNTQIILQSVLPTSLPMIPSYKIHWINQQLATIAQQERAYYLNLYALFADNLDGLNATLTTDGLHLNQRGYQVWQQALTQAEATLASARQQRHRLVSQESGSAIFPETLQEVTWSR